VAEIRVSHEAARGCGYRKEGGKYLIGGELSAPCGRLPLHLDRCPTCSGGVKFTRGFTWVNAARLFESKECLGFAKERGFCAACPMGAPPEKAGLIWIGEKFYPTEQDFTREAGVMGISRRLSTVPRVLEKCAKDGEGWPLILLAHRKTAFPPATVAPGIFAAFRPTAIEYVVKGTEKVEELEKLEERGFKLVQVVRVGEQLALPEAEASGGLADA